jgi:DNA-binding FrmR family transcriptional regulator
MTQDKEQIIYHIKRLEGQLASVRTELEKDTVDCARASTTLLSAARSFAGLREVFIESFLMKYFVPEVDSADQVMFSKLLSLIKG